MQAVVTPSNHNQSVDEYFADEHRKKNPIVLQRQIKSQMGTRRPMNEELNIEVGH